MGFRHEIHVTAGSAYMESEEELRGLESGDKELSDDHAQRIPGEERMVNYMGSRNVGVEGGEGALASLYTALANMARKKPEMHKAFPHEDVLIGKGKGLQIFHSVSLHWGSQKVINAREL